MDTQEFEQIVKARGLVLEGRWDGSPTELVLTVSTLPLDKTQLATNDDVEAAGFIKAEKLRHTQEKLLAAKRRNLELEANLQALHQEKDRLEESIHQDWQNRFQALEEKLSSLRVESAALESALRAEWEVQLQELETQLEASRVKNDRLGAERQRLETLTTAQQAGTLARQNELSQDANPHHGEDPYTQAIHAAWQTAWERQDDLITFKNRLTEAQIEKEALSAELESSRAELAAGVHLQSSNRTLSEEIVRLGQERNLLLQQLAKRQY
jgi:predicted nuclease with TOPRIM domain